MKTPTTVAEAVDQELQLDQLKDCITEMNLRRRDRGEIIGAVEAPSEMYGWHRRLYYFSKGFPVMLRRLWWAGSWAIGEWIRGWASSYRW